MTKLVLGAEVVNINKSSSNMRGRRGTIIAEGLHYWKVQYDNGTVQDYRKATAPHFIAAMQHATAKKEQPMQQPLTNLSGKYIIWSPSGTHNPRVVHGTWEVADEEARRLTMQHEHVFYVAELKAKYSVQVTKAVMQEF